MKAPFSSQATLTIINCDNTPEAQSDSIDSLVKQGYNAILVDASSPSALNPAIDRAIAAGVVIVSFDQVVDHDGAWKIETDFDKIPKSRPCTSRRPSAGRATSSWTAVCPARRSQSSWRMARAQYSPSTPALISWPAYDGQYAQGPTLQGMNSIMASRPKISAVFTQGYTGPVIKALNDAGSPDGADVWIRL